MKIAHITYTFKPIKGGLEVYLKNLYDFLNIHDHEQKIFQINHGIQSAELKLIDKIRYVPGHLSFFIRLFFLKKELAQFDLLIIHFAEFYYPLRWHKNTLVLSHGATWTAENGIKKWLRKFATSYAIQHSPKYVFNDSFVPRYFGFALTQQTRFFQEFTKGKWFIPNCVDIKRFTTVKYINKIKKLSCILVPRNLTYQRGIDLAIRAFNIFNKKYPDTNLVITGSLINKKKKYLQYQNYLMELIDQLNIKSKVHFIGSVSNDKMPSIFSSSQMTIIPTRCSEGTSLSALESMACGTATISTNIEGLLDLPTIKCDLDYKNMANKMLEIYSKRLQIAKKQQNIVREKYNINNWQQAWKEAISLEKNAKRSEVRQNEI